MARKREKEMIETLPCMIIFVIGVTVAFFAGRISK